MVKGRAGGLAASSELIAQGSQRGGVGGVIARARSLTSCYDQSLLISGEAEIRPSFSLLPSYQLCSISPRPRHFTHSLFPVLACDGDSLSSGFPSVAVGARPRHFLMSSQRPSFLSPKPM